MHKKSNSSLFRVAQLLIAMCCFLNSCFVFSNYKTAHLLSQNNFEILPNVTLTTFDPTYNNGVIFSYGISGNYGLTNRFNLGARYSRIHVSEYNIDYNYFSINPIFGIIKEQIAISLATGLYFGQNVEYTESVNIQPCIVFTQRITDRLHLTISPECTIFLPNFNRIYAINLNISYSILPNYINIIPEIGYAYNKGKGNKFLFGGIGFSFSRPICVAKKNYEK